MKLSHSKLSCILANPMEYFLSYKMGIFPKVKKAALSIGSAVHWGIEHNTEDLSEYYKEEGTFKQGDNYTDDQLLAEAMVHGYFKNKDKIFDEILTDSKTGEKLQLIEETHEIYLTGKLKSLSQNVPHDFVGIIDLLLLTDKGFIIIDYKTSSREPDWDSYIEQIYRYIFLLETCFPEIPIVKLGIVNLRKTGIRKKVRENNDSFRARLRQEYELNDEAYVTAHMYEPEKLNRDLLDEYILNLSRMADAAAMIELNNMWFINYGAANGPYRSDFWDIYYKTPSCFVLYNIMDTIYDKEAKKMLQYRDCRPLDMMVIDKKNVLNKYEQFKAQSVAFYSVRDDINKEELFEHLKKNYIVDDELLEEYWDTLVHEIEEGEKNESI